MKIKTIILSITTVCALVMIGSVILAPFLGSDLTFRIATLGGIGVLVTLGFSLISDYL